MAQNNAPLEDWVADDVVALLGELGVSPEDDVLCNLRQKRFATAKHGGSWLSAFPGGEHCTLRLIHNDAGLYLCLYPRNGRTLVQEQQDACVHANRRLYQLWLRRDAAPPQAPLGRRSRRSPLAARAALQAV